MAGTLPAHVDERRAILAAAVSAFAHDGHGRAGAEHLAAMENGPGAGPGA